MGFGTFIRAWVEQNDSQRTRRITLLRKLASQDPVLREVFGRVNTELNSLIDQPFFMMALINESDSVESAWAPLPIFSPYP